MSRLIGRGSGLGPVYVVRVEQAKRSLGLSKRPDSHDKTYLVLSDLFFRAYDQASPSVGYDGGNFTLWFFVHEIVHLAEFRSLPQPDAPPPSYDQQSEIFRILKTKIEQVKSALSSEGIDFNQYVLGKDLASRVVIVRNFELPTKYSLLSVQEALAEL